MGSSAPPRRPGLGIIGLVLLFVCGAACSSTSPNDATTVTGATGATVATAQSEVFAAPTSGGDDAAGHDQGGEADDDSDRPGDGGAMAGDRDGSGDVGGVVPPPRVASLVALDQPQPADPPARFIAGRRFDPAPGMGEAFSVATGNNLGAAPHEARSSASESGRFIDRLPYPAMPAFDLDDLQREAEVAGVPWSLVEARLGDARADFVRSATSGIEWVDPVFGGELFTSGALAEFVDMLPDGRPVSVWWEEGVGYWHVHDASTGEVVRDISPLGEPVIVDVAVQRSGNLVVAEGPSSSPGGRSRWGGVVIDPLTWERLAEFPMGDGRTPVLDIDYDASGTWLLILLDDGTIEIQGRGQVLNPPGNYSDFDIVSW